MPAAAGWGTSSSEQLWDPDTRLLAVGQGPAARGKPPTLPPPLTLPPSPPAPRGPVASVSLKVLGPAEGGVPIRGLSFLLQTPRAVNPTPLDTHALSHLALVAASHVGSLTGQESTDLKAAQGH